MLGKKSSKETKGKNSTEKEKANYNCDTIYDF